MVDLVNTARKAPDGLGVMYWVPEYALRNICATPGPAVFTLDSLKALAKSLESHAPARVDH